MSAEYCIETIELVKKYGNFTAVNKVSLKIRKNICFGLLGPNGAGKTSYMEMIEGISEKTAGKILVNNLDLQKNMKQIQPRMSVQLQENNYFEYVGLDRLLQFFLNIYPPSDRTVNSLLKLVGLTDKSKSKYRQLSGGQKQRFSIAVALVNDADLIFLDEPTTGLDPQNRQFIWEIINKLKKKQKTIFLTTHNMEEADVLCDELAIMDHARVIALGTPNELKQTIIGKETINFIVESGSRDLKGLESCNGIETLVHLPVKHNWKIWTNNLLLGLNSLLEFTNKNKIKLEQIKVDKVTLEDVFLKLTGREIRE